MVLRREKRFSPSEPLDMLVVGLGNPGPEYEGTRHNVGWEVVGVLRRRASVSLSKAKERAMVGSGTIDALRLAFALPLTSMNCSGEAVRPLMKRYDVPAERLLVVYDDIDLAFGRLRIRSGGGTGGHQGLNSVVAHIGTRDFLRLKIGLGRPPGRMDPAVYVLRRFTKAERAEMDVVVEQAADAVLCIAKDGVEVAMNRYN